MCSLDFDFREAHEFLSDDLINSKKHLYNYYSEMLQKKTGLGNEFLGWLDLPEKMLAGEIKRIEETGKTLRENYDAVVTLGIGGSYLGAKAAYEIFSFRDYPVDLYFAGNSISTLSVKEILDRVKDRNFALIVISKSGTTLETSIAFRVFTKLLKEQHGEDFHKSIYAITDKEKGALRAFADKYGIESFVIPDDVGGRFSVLTPVGLLPLAAIGIDVRKMLLGAREQKEKMMGDYHKDVAYQYAAYRNLLYSMGKEIEILSFFEPHYRYLGEWWKQLFGESEGKFGRGIFPASAVFSTDLHSLGQMIQDGKRNLFKTFLFSTCKENIAIPEMEDDFDNLNRYAGKTFAEINRIAYLATKEAHKTGGAPVMSIETSEISEYLVGALFYFFQKAVAYSGYMLHVNPFDQPGVEEYKKNIKKLLND